MIEHVYVLLVVLCVAWLVHPRQDLRHLTNWQYLRLVVATAMFMLVVILAMFLLTRWAA